MDVTRRAFGGIVGGVALAALAGCGRGGGSDPSNPDELTMWARSSTQKYAAPLVKAYNESHRTQIKLTIIATDSFQQKVGAAAGAASLPDILAADVVYSPNYAKQSIFADLSDRIRALPFGDKLVKAHIDAASFEGAQYAVPFKVDSSFIFYNKSLFQRAGLNPDSPPKTYDDIYAAAREIDGLGEDVHGFYFPGNCAGCSAYTTFGVAKGGGTPPISSDGKQAQIDSKAISDWLTLYGRLYSSGFTPEDVITGDTSRQQEPFLQQRIGVWPNGSYSIPAVNERGIEWGYIPLGTADGTGTGTMVGGDVIGISSVTQKKDAAWDFIAWTLSEQTQIDIIAKGGNFSVRTDLGSNEYTQKDPRLVTIATGMQRGYTPSTIPYGEAFNSPNGPWLTAVRGVVFKGDQNALTVGQREIQTLMNGAY